MEDKGVPEKIDVMSSLLQFTMETNVLLNVMTDVLIGIRTKDMSQVEKDKYSEVIEERLKEYREKSKTFLMPAKN